MNVSASPSVHAAEQALQSLPNPGKVREIWLDISYYGPQGSHTVAIVIVALVVVAIIAIATCITVYNVKRVRR